MSRQVVEFLTTTDSGQSWTVPAGVTSLKVELIAAGAFGSSGSNSATSKGGSGGGYARKDALAVTPGEVLTYYVSPTTGSNSTGARGNPTYFKSLDTVAASTGQNITGGNQQNVGGAMLAGDYGTNGGNVVNAGRTGGGGAGGPHGPGGNNLGGGAGGGAANGGGTNNGAVGGSNRLGYGGGAAGNSSSSPTDGSNGGGGGGGTGTTNPFYHGANGSQDTIWTSTLTGDNAGPGSGGGASAGTGYGGNGGGYGSGGGGGRSYTAGRLAAGPGIIVLTYTVEEPGFSYSYWL